jgi:DnaJ-class molecular chaperone
MEANIYQQISKEIYNIEVTYNDLKSGYIKVDCHTCNGTGEFLITDTDKQECVKCRGTGKVWVSLI